MTRDEKKTKVQLIEELVELRRQNAKLETTVRLDGAHLESDEKFRLVTESIQDVFWISTPGVLEMVYVSPAYEKIWRRSRESLYESPRSFLEVVHPDDLSEYLTNIEEFHAKGKDYECQYRILPAGDMERWINERGFSIRDDNGKLVMMTGICTDITERKKAENELAHSHELLRYILEHNNAAVAVHDRDLKYIYVSQSYLDQYKVKEPDVIGRHHYEVFPDLPQKWRDVHQRVLKGEICSVDDDAYERADGSVDWTRWECRPWYEADGSVGGLIVYTEVITERKLAEAKLRESEERFRNLAQLLPEMVFETDAELNVTYANERGFDEIGYSPEDLSAGLHAFDIIVPQDRDRAWANFARRASGQDPGPTEYTALRKDGSTFPVLFHASSIVKQGRMQGVRGVIVDITQLKRAETDLLKFKLGIERCEEAIFITDSAGVFQYVNPAFEQVYGFTRDDVVGKTPRILRSGLVDRKVYDEFWKTLVSKAVVAGEIVNKKKDGNFITVYSTANPILDENDNILGYLAIQRDITEKKRAEQDQLALEVQVLQAQKVDSLGVLAGGIAHDFNNLLTGVLGNAELAMDDLPPESPARESIEAIQGAAKRAAELANQMLAYSGKGHFIVKPVNLSEIVREMGHLLSASVSKKTALSYHLDEGIPAIEADVSQLRQVVMNLITNATEALEGQTGTVTVTTGVKDCVDGREIRGLVAGSLSKGSYSYLEVSDSGVGMDAETVAKMFEPFFTTKFTGRGLGLAALFGIVRGHKGAVQVASAPQKGTTVTVLFPVTAKPVASRPDSAGSELKETAQGTILLVDDETTVLDVGTKMLTRAGYEVRTARDGNEAIEMFREHSRDTDCVILDLTMPNKDGEETFVELQKISKEVPVILSSGYNVGDVEERISKQGFAGFLQKPYRVNALMRAIREALAKQG